LASSKNASGAARKKGSGAAADAASTKGKGKGKGGKAKATFAAPPPRKQAPAVQPDPMAGMSGTEKVVWVSLHALVFLVALGMANANWLAGLGLSAFGLPITFDQFDIIKVFAMRACALIGIGAWSFGFFLRGGTLRRTKADWLILAFLAWVLISSFFSISPATAIFGKYRRFEGFLSFLTYATVYFLTVQVVDRPSRIRSIAHSIVVSGAIVSFYGMLQFFGLDPVNWGTQLPFEFNRAFSTYGNPDLLGGYLIFPLVVSLAMALTDKRPLWRAVYWSAFILTGLCWGAAFVRGAWIGGGVALIILAVAAVLARVPWGVVDWSAVGVTGLLGSAFVARSLRSTNEVLNIGARIASTFQFDQGSALTRFQIWSAALRAVKERPIFGFGADTFRLVFPHTKPVEYVQAAGYLSVADNVHNYPLQLAAGIGIPGFLLLYGLFGWVLYLGVPNAFARNKGPERLIIAGFWAAIVGYIVHLMFGLSVTGCTVFLWLSMAMIVAPTARSVQIPPKVWGPAVGIVIAAVVTAASIYNVAYVVADRYYLLSQFGGTGIGDRVQYSMDAIRLNPFNDMYRSQLASNYNKQMLAWIDEARTLQQGGNDPGAALAQAKQSFLASEKAFQDVMAFVPTEYDNYVFLTALYNQAGSYFDPSYFEQAVTTGKKGIEVEPYGPAVRFQTALALYNLGRTKEVITLLEETVKMDSNYADPMLVLGDVYSREGEKAKARAMYQAVLSIAASSTPAGSQAMSGLATLDGTVSAEPSPTTP
jgi:O-antigen ligase/predicted negative regulator of RcsB-dependent stress response